MAIQSGRMRGADGEYHGPPLNRVARLLSIGHGGQIRISAVARDLMRSSFRRRGMLLVDLGEHRLKDLTRPEHVFEGLRLQV